jgi:hypothetical protein
MYYEAIKDKKASEFKRLTGVKKETFVQMVLVLEKAATNKLKAGRKSKLSTEDQLLLTLSYWREYRTQYHLAASYGIHESTANRIINKVEDCLVSSGAFSLPNKRQVEQTEWVVVVVDATEMQIERPQKNSDATTQERSISTASKCN